MTRVLLWVGFVFSCTRLAFFGLVGLLIGVLGLLMSAGLVDEPGDTSDFIRLLISWLIWWLIALPGLIGASMSRRALRLHARRMQDGARGFEVTPSGRHRLGEDESRHRRFVVICDIGHTRGILTLGLIPLFSVPLNAGEVAVPKAMFTQGVALLTGRPLAERAVDAALRPFNVLRKKPPEGGKNWVAGYPAWIMPMQPHGLVIVEVVDAPWPDEMGGHGGADDPSLFPAWGVGAFGPHAWPGNLARAKEFARFFGREETADAAERHAAFVRVRSSFMSNPHANASGKKRAEAELPDYNARLELEFVTSIAQAIAQADGVSCYFNPGGETILSPGEMNAILAEAASNQLPPLPLWMSPRVAPVETATGWYVADTIGLAQLDACDQEALFERDKHDVNEVIEFINGVSHYLLDNPDAIEDDDTTDGPGGTIWRSRTFNEGLLPGDRLGLLRWFSDDSPPPAELLQRDPTDDDAGDD